ncbi:YcxB family protein [Brachyspira hyodysenteriae]|uniref:YcxB family protein n=1 Tax=Brachyspira hyodysenteriae TaxID=159 RepID=UPI0022CD2726|nr:YcxB family protein [Brachyspira hyodysenteriae]MCZ9946202.1 YcxB family protein [Brachyspira hyodysenteriae]
MKKEYKYKLTEDDFIDFQLHYLRINSNMTSSIKKTIIILIALYIVVFVSMAIYFRDNAFLIIIIALLVSAFSVLQIVTYKKRLEKKIVKKVKEYVRSGKLDKVFGDKELTIYDDKVIFKEDRGTTSGFNKDEIKKIDSTNKCVFFYIDEMSAIIIPKQILSSEDIDFLISYKK